MEIREESGIPIQGAHGSSRWLWDEGKRRE